MTGQALIVQGDALRLPLPGRSVDAIVTDPPYGLKFMGKKWDDPGAFVERRPNRGNKWDMPGGNHNPTSSEDVARTRLVEGRRYQAWCEQWAAEALRVLRPGGWLLAFGGTRTWHRLACGLEDAGFEMRDTIAEFGPLAWLYGSGFPKGKGCLKPAWEPVIVARRPGSSVLQIDASRIPGTWTTWRRSDGSINHDQHEASSYAWDGERREHPSGRWPSNVALIHSEGCQPTGTRKIRGNIGIRGRNALGLINDDGWQPKEEGQPVGYADADGMEEVIAWTCEENCPVFLLDQQSGTLHSQDPRTRQSGKVTGGQMFNLPGMSACYADQGGASRFMYTAKAGPNERVTIDGDSHPTVKPLALMRWLVRLITPPGGTVLDMFAGSGTTGEAAMLEGFRCVLIDKDPTNLPSIRVRTHPYVRRTKIITNGQRTSPEQGSLL